jgi:hypothetical protein
MALPVNNTSLINEMRTTLAQINQQIEQATRDTEKYIQGLPYPSETTIFMIKRSDGQYILTELLCAKAQLLNGIANLQAASTKR